MWSAKFFFNVLWSASQESLGNTGLDCRTQPQLYDIIRWQLHKKHINVSFYVHYNCLCFTYETLYLMLLKINSNHSYF
jgi:hypothetical protein